MSLHKTKPAPRSVLFIPADRPDFAAKASTTGADAVCFDLEDAIASTAKASARELLSITIAAIDQSSLQIYVRVNSELELIADDLKTALKTSIDGVVLPKARSLEHIALVAEAITRLENKPASTALIAMIENIAGLHNLSQESRKAPSSLTGLLFGPEDYSADMGVPPNKDLLDKSFLRMVECARLLGVQAYGFPGSIAQFGDLDALATDLQRALNFGATGAFCIHPTQAPIINGAFSPTADDIKWAEQTLATYSNAQGKGVIANNQQMIDRPVLYRARRILARTKNLKD